MFHPLGRIVVFFFIPMGVNAVELFGFACFIAILVIILYPWIKRIKIHREERVYNEIDFDYVDSEIAKFMYQLSMLDKKGEFTPYFRKVIEAGLKHNQQRLILNFIEYYGNLTLKFLDSEKFLSENNVSSEINNAKKNVSQALQDIKTYCNKFVTALLEGSIVDLKADIKVLGLVSNEFK